MAELAFKGVDLRRADGSVWFWLVHGWVDELATVEGEDREVALRHGMDPHPRLKRRRKIELRGALKAATWAGMLALQQEMLTTFDPTARGSLVVADEYKGLGAGVTASLTSVLPIALTPAADQTEFHRLYTATMESIAVPPEWSFAGP